MKLTREQIRIQILARIEVASPESPISVFRDSNGVRSVFGRTVQTDYWIAKGYPHHVGTFDSSYNPTTVKRLLIEAESVLN